MRATHSDRVASAISALELAFEPLVDLLLDLGITSRRAEDVLRDVFVRTARKKLSRQVPRVSTSLVALRCGLYRHEVRKRLSKTSRAKGGLTSDTHKLSQLISGWHEDPEFLSRSGKPRALPYEGPRSFGTLVSRYTAFMYPAIVKAELQRSGVIVAAPGGRLRVVSREYRGKEFDERRLADLGEKAKDVLTTLVGDALNRADSPILLQAMGFNVDPRYVPFLRTAIKNRAEIFMRLLDQELNHESRRAREGEGVRVGMMLIGVYGGPQEADVDAEPVATRGSGEMRKKRRGRVE